MPSERQRRRKREKALAETRGAEEQETKTAKGEEQKGDSKGEQLAAQTAKDTCTEIAALISHELERQLGIGLSEKENSEVEWCTEIYTQRLIDVISANRDDPRNIEIRGVKLEWTRALLGNTSQEPQGEAQGSHDEQARSSAIGTQGSYKETEEQSEANEGAQKPHDGTEARYAYPDIWEKACQQAQVEHKEDVESTVPLSDRTIQIFRMLKKRHKALLKKKDKKKGQD